MYDGIKDMSREDQIKLLKFDQQRLLKEGHPRALCWFCDRAASTKDKMCKWALNFEHIDGWQAIKDRVDGYDTVCVIDCPEFVFDRLK